MNRHLLARDERELNVDQAADRLSYLVVSFGLLALVAYRSLARGEASWDLLGLVVLGGLVGTTYRLRQRVVSRRWVWVLGLTFGLALVIGAVLAVVVRT